MSLVTVHGPNTMYTDSPGVVASTPAGAKATQNPTNGLQFTFALSPDSTRDPRDFSWAFPTDGTPSPQSATKTPSVVSYATPGTKTATLTVVDAARALANKALTSNVATLTTTVAHGFLAGQSVAVVGVGAPFDGTYVIASVPSPTTFTYAKTNADVTSAVATGTASPSGMTPAAGTYNMTVKPVSGTPKMVQAQSSNPGQQQQQRTEPSPEVDVGYDPAAHTVDEVVEYAEEHPDQVEDIIAAERAGKERSTLLSHLQHMQH